MRRKICMSSYQDIFGVNAGSYDGIPLSSLNMTRRSYNSLMRSRITTLGELLRQSDNSLSKHKGVSISVIDETNETLSLYFQNNSILIEENTRIEKSVLIREAKDILDPELINQCREKTDYVKTIIRGLSDYSSSTTVVWRLRKTLRAGLREITNKNILEANVLGLINAYTDDPDLRCLLTINNLLDTKTLEDYINEIILNSEQYIEISDAIKPFVSWCNFDLNNDIENIISNVFASDRTKQIIIGRMESKTLAELGEIIGVTRERIRQCEGKSQRLFDKLIDNSRLIRKIYAIRNRDSVLTEQELSLYFGEHSDVLLYLLKRSSSTDFSYRSDLKAFIVEDYKLLERASKYLNELPDIFLEEKYKGIIERAITDNGLTEELVVQYIEVECKTKLESGYV